MRYSAWVGFFVVTKRLIIFIGQGSLIGVFFLKLPVISLLISYIFEIVLRFADLGLTLFWRQTLVLMTKITAGFLSALPELSLQLLYLILCFLQFALKFLIFLVMIVLNLSILNFPDFRRKLALALFSFQFHHFLVVVGLAYSVHFSQSLHSFALIFDSLEVLFLVLGFLFLMFSLTLCQLMLGFELIFNCLADQGIGGCSLDIFDIQASKILFFPRWRTNDILIDDSFFSNS